MNRLVTALRRRRNRERIYSDPGYWNERARRGASGRSASMWPNEALNALYEAEFARALSSSVGAVSGARVLDAGCGTGRLSRRLASMGADVAGFDFAEDAIRAARAASPEPPPAYAVASVFDFDAGGAYDLAVTCSLLAVACRDRVALDAALRRLASAVKPGGRFFFAEPVHRGPFHRVLDLSPAEFAEALDEAGFEVRGARGLHFLPARLLLAWLPWPGWITRAVHAAGQRAMALAGGADYTAFFGVRRP